MSGKTKEELALISKATQFTSENQPENRGRKKKLPELDVLLADLLGGDDGEIDGSEAKAVLNALIKEAKNGNVQAGVAVLNRAYGMPKQAIDHGGQKDNPVNILSTLPVERQAEYLRLLIVDNAINA